MDTSVIQIKSGYFTAGLVFNREGRVTQAAPIIKYMKGWYIGRVHEYCLIKGWKYTHDSNN